MDNLKDLPQFDIEAEKKNFTNVYQSFKKYNIHNSPGVIAFFNRGVCQRVERTNNIREAIISELMYNRLHRFAFFYTANYHPTFINWDDFDRFYQKQNLLYWYLIGRLRPVDVVQDNDIEYSVQSPIGRSVVKDELDAIFQTDMDDFQFECYLEYTGQWLHEISPILF
jgi:hypothetical protein